MTFSSHRYALFQLIWAAPFAVLGVGLVFEHDPLCVLALGLAVWWIWRALTLHLNVGGGQVEVRNMLRTYRVRPEDVRTLTFRGEAPIDPGGRSVARCIRIHRPRGRPVDIHATAWLPAAERDRVIAAIETLSR